MGRYSAAISEHPDSAVAAGEVIGEVLESIGPEPDLVVLFTSNDHRDAIEEIAEAIREALMPRILLGSTAVSIIGGPREVESRPAISLWAATECPASPIRLEAVRTGDGWGLSGVPSNPQGTLMVLPDPFSFPSEALLEAVPDVKVVGGMASAASAPGGNRLVLNDQIHSDGAVGVLLDPEVKVQTVVSQGCRPIGQPFTVTRSEGNIVEEIGGRTGVDRLRETLLALSEADRALAAKGLHVGIVTDEHKSEFDRGDFLIRGLVSINEQTGALAVGDNVEVGVTIQFQVRDAATSDEDLRALMADVSGGSALVFTCNGRGRHLFNVPDHDASVVHEALGRVPIAGMFCAGELGPVGERNFIHGFTASVVLFPN